jgi:hypothetical protein
MQVVASSPHPPFLPVETAPRAPGQDGFAQACATGLMTRRLSFMSSI